MSKKRCEGWTRTGGAFTLGPVSWSQCPNDAVVKLKVKQEGRISLQPACLICWDKGKASGIKIISAQLIKTGRPKHD